jgi:hypothetical protein
VAPRPCTQSVCDSKALLTAKFGNVSGHRSVRLWTVTTFDCERKTGEGHFLIKRAHSNSLLPVEVSLSKVLLRFQDFSIFAPHCEG